MEERMICKLFLRFVFFRNILTFHFRETLMQLNMDLGIKLSEQLHVQNWTTFVKVKLFHKNITAKSDYAKNITVEALEKVKSIFIY